MSNTCLPVDKPSWGFPIFWVGPGDEPKAGAHWGTRPTNCRQIIDAESAVVDHDRVLKIHKGLESSSADSYLYPQKSLAVRSGERTRLSLVISYNEVSYTPLIPPHAGLPWVIKWLYTAHKSGSAPDPRRRNNLRTDLGSSKIPHQHETFSHRIHPKTY